MIVRFIFEVDEFGLIRHDWVLAAYDDLLFRGWRGLEVVNYKLLTIDGITKEYKDYVPVGSVEFVRKFNEVCYDGKLDLRPLNIPDRLISLVPGVYNIRKKYCNIIYSNNNDMKPDFKNGRWHVKSSNVVKHNLNGEYTDLLHDLHNGSYQISEHRDNIVSEWRCFVRNSELLDCRCYDGDFKRNPDWDYIDKAIRTFNYQYPYTLDVMVTADGRTYVIECHDFWSVGLYGFNRQGISNMFEQSFNGIKKRSNIILNK